MVKRIFRIFIFALLISRITFLCFAEEQNVYHNSDGHCPFIIPDGWIEYPKDAMDELNTRVSQLSGGKVKYEIGFHKIEEWGYPHFYLQILKNGRWTEKDLESIVNKEKYNKIVKKTESNLNSLSWEFKNFKVNQSIYDVKRNILLVSLGSTREDSGYVLGVSALILSNYGSVNIAFFSLENNFDNDLVYFNQILESFKFDEGFKY